jgi:hypothetical protein
MQHSSESPRCGSHGTLGSPQGPAALGLLIRHPRHHA